MKTRQWIAVVAIVAAVCLGCTLAPAPLSDLFVNQGEAAGFKDTVTITKDEYDRLKALDEKYAKLEQALAYIQMYYYIDPDYDVMLDGAVAGLLAGLDDIYTFYYSADSWSTLWEDDEGVYGGIGIQILGNTNDQSVTITRVFRGTPAEQAGLLKGDKLIRVEELDVTATTMNDAVQIMRGVIGENVHLEVLRDNVQMGFDMKRAEISVNRIEAAMMDGDVGYIVLYEFAGESDAEFDAALDGLIEQGAKSIILDLRDNPGGWVDQAISIADRFIDDGLIMYSEDRFGNTDKSFGKKGAVDIPLVLLVNENSASSSEILAGALKDYDRATLVGVNTYGKGVIQYVVELGDGTSGMQFTVAQYYTPEGHQVHGQGIAPHIEVELPEDTPHYLPLASMQDAQIAEAWRQAVELISK